MKSCRNFSQQTIRSTHWTLNLCFGAFRTIWVHLGEFGCVTKLSAKWAEQVQNFVPRGRFLIFHNKHTQLALLGPKVMSWCVSYCLDAFGTVWLPYKTRCKTGRTGAKVCAMKSCQNFSQRTHSIHPIGPKFMFQCVSYYLGAFGRVW